MTRRTATVYSEALPGESERLCCQLVVIEGADAGRAVRLGDAEVVVGSEEGCDLRLDDERVSGRHLAVRAQDRQFAVRDLGSKNGVLYQGSQVTAAMLPIGATVRVGRTYLRIQPQRQPLEVEPSQSRRFGDLRAESLAMRELFAVLELASRSEVTVLLEGETGTGKELAARALHENSPRRARPFVAVDCGALPEGLLESELFGHVRGAFTGASNPRAGAFARADGGTIFLDELGRVTPTVQARLLRVLEERRIKPLGSDEERAVDVRIVAASRDDLDARVADGSFRADLFYRLSVIRVVLPPLRDRREDIEPIVVELLRGRGFAELALTADQRNQLIAHSWPGNVRELRNVVDRAVALAPGATRAGDLRLAVAGVSGEPGLSVRTDLPYAEAKQAIHHVFERRYLADVLARCGGNISATARETGIDRKHLRALLRRHGLVES